MNLERELSIGMMGNRYKDDDQVCMVPTHVGDWIWNLHVAYGWILGMCKVQETGYGLMETVVGNEVGYGGMMTEVEDRYGG